MKTFIQAVLAVGIAGSSAALVSAAELDGTDPVVASFYRDFNREPTQGAGARVAREQDRLPAILRAALNGGDPVVASFHRDMHREPVRSSEAAGAARGQDRLPEMVRAALEEGMASRRNEQVAARRD